MLYSFSRRAFPNLPEDVVTVMTSSLYTEFASLTAAGLPIDTPLFAFVGPDGATIDVATGVAYPSKANRVRRQPKVGLLLEGTRSPKEPVVSVAGYGSVRDADIQANLDRYLAETAAQLPITSGGRPWSVVRQAVWYWSRIIVQTTPARVAWWPSADRLDEPPTVWNAPPGTLYAESDPAPAGPGSPAAAWGQASDWRPRACEVLEVGMAGHLTVCDREGFPLPFRMRAVALSDQGFVLDVPLGAPWTPKGPATLSFAGEAIFVGQVEPCADGGAHLTVERKLPELPLLGDSSNLWTPNPETESVLMGRLECELKRRNLALPVVPDTQPEPSEGSLVRTHTRIRADS